MVKQFYLRVQHGKHIRSIRSPSPPFPAARSLAIHILANYPRDSSYCLVKPIMTENHHLNPLQNLYSLMPTGWLEHILAKR